MLGKNPKLKRHGDIKMHGMVQISLVNATE